MKKRILSLLLAVLMIASLLPAHVLAEDDEGGNGFQRFLQVGYDTDDFLVSSNPDLELEPGFAYALPTGQVTLSFTPQSGANFRGLDAVWYNATGDAPVYYLRTDEFTSVDWISFENGTYTITIPENLGLSIGLISTNVVISREYSVSYPEGEYELFELNGTAADYRPVTAEGKTALYDYTVPESGTAELSFRVDCAAASELPWGVRYYVVNVDEYFVSRDELISSNGEFTVPNLTGEGFEITVYPTFWDYVDETWFKSPEEALYLRYAWEGGNGSVEELNVFTAEEEDYYDEQGDPFCESCRGLRTLAGDTVRFSVDPGECEFKGVEVRSASGQETYLTVADMQENGANPSYDAENEIVSFTTSAATDKSTLNFKFELLQSFGVIYNEERFNVSCNAVSESIIPGMRYFLASDAEAYLYVTVGSEADDAVFRGILTYVDGTEVRVPKTSLTCEEGVYRIPLSEYEDWITICDGDEVMAGEYRVIFDREEGSVSVNGAAVVDWDDANHAPKFYSYSSSEETPFNLNLTFRETVDHGGESKAPYAVEYNVFGANRGDTVLRQNSQELQNGTFALNNLKGSAVEIRVYWTEQQYLFDTFNMTPGVHGIHYFFDGAGSVSTLGLENGVFYKNEGKLHFSQDKTVRFTLYPDPGQSLYEVELDGERISVSELNEYLYEADDQVTYRPFCYDEENQSLTLDPSHLYGIYDLRFHFTEPADRFLYVSFDSEGGEAILDTGDRTELIEEYVDINLRDYGETRVLFRLKEGEPDWKMRGLHVYFWNRNAGDTESWIFMNELEVDSVTGLPYLTIPDGSECRIQVLSSSSVSGEYDLRFDQTDNAAVYEVTSGGDVRRYAWRDDLGHDEVTPYNGSSVTFRVVGPDDGTGGKIGPYAAEVYVHGQGPYRYYGSGADCPVRYNPEYWESLVWTPFENGCMTVDELNGEGFSVQIWWTKESFDYDHFPIVNGDHAITYHLDGKGSVEVSGISPSVICDDRGEGFFGQEDPIIFTLHPEAGQTLRDFEIDGVCMDAEDLLEGYTYELYRDENPDNDCYCPVTYDRENETLTLNTAHLLGVHNLWIRFTDLERQLNVYFNGEEVQVFITEDGDGQLCEISEWRGEVDLRGYEDILVFFKLMEGEPAWKLRGLQVRMHGLELDEESWIRISDLPLDPATGMRYLRIPEGCGCEIWTKSDSPLSNEYGIHYDQNDAFVYEVLDTETEALRLDWDEENEIHPIYGYTGSSVSFHAVGPENGAGSRLAPYAVRVYGNGWEKDLWYGAGADRPRGWNEDEWNSITWTPIVDGRFTVSGLKGEGLEVSVWWTKEAFDFDHYEIINGNHAFRYRSEGWGAADTNDLNDPIRYGNEGKGFFTQEQGTVRFTLAPEVGQTLREIEFDGERIEASDLLNDGYTFWAYRDEDNPGNNSYTLAVYDPATGTVTFNTSHLFGQHDVAFFFSEFRRELRVDYSENNVAMQYKVGGVTRELTNSDNLDLTGLGEATVYITVLNDVPDYAVRGLQVNRMTCFGDQEEWYFLSDLTVDQVSGAYVFEIPEDCGCEIWVKDETAINGEYRLFYDQADDATVYEVIGGSEEERRDCEWDDEYDSEYHPIYSYSGDSVTLRLAGPRDEENRPTQAYAVRVWIHNRPEVLYARQGVSLPDARTIENDRITIDQLNGEGFEVQIWWTEEDYRWDRYDFDWERDKVVRVETEGCGDVTVTGLVDPVYSRGGTTGKATGETFELSLSAWEYESFAGIRYDGVDYTATQLEQGCEGFLYDPEAGTITVQVSTLNFGWNDVWVSFTGDVNFGRDVCVNYEDWAFDSVIVSWGEGESYVANGQWVNPGRYDDTAISFRLAQDARPNENVRGIRVHEWMWGTEIEQDLRIPLDLLAYDTDTEYYTFSLGTQWSANISVIQDGEPFAGEYRLYYDQSNDACVYEVVGENEEARWDWDREAEMSRTYPYEGTAVTPGCLTFRIDGPDTEEGRLPVYAVQVQYADDWENVSTIFASQNTDLASGILKLRDLTGEPLQIQIWFSEENYLFDILGTENEDEIMVRCNVDGNGSVDAAEFIRSQTGYDNCVKGVVRRNGENAITFALTPEAAESFIGYTLEGRTYPADSEWVEYNGNGDLIITLGSECGDWYDINFYFTGGDFRSEIVTHYDEGFFDVTLGTVPLGDNEMKRLPWDEDGMSLTIRLKENAELDSVCVRLWRSMFSENGVYTGAVVGDPWLKAGTDAFYELFTENEDGTYTFSIPKNTSVDLELVALEKGGFRIYLNQDLGYDGSGCLYVIAGTEAIPLEAEDENRQPILYEYQGESVTFRIEGPLVEESHTDACAVRVSISGSEPYEIEPEEILNGEFTVNAGGYSFEVTVWFDQASYDWDHYESEYFVFDYFVFDQGKNCYLINDGEDKIVTSDQEFWNWSVNWRAKPVNGKIQLKLYPEDGSGLCSLFVVTQEDPTIYVSDLIEQQVYDPETHVLTLEGLDEPGWTLVGLILMDMPTVKFVDPADVPENDVLLGAIDDAYFNYEIPAFQDPVRAGYVFSGWNTKRDGTGTAFEAGNNFFNFVSEETLQDLTLYAQWTANSYTVTFKPNGGTGTMQKQSFTYGTEPKALNANGYARTGYLFDSWNTAADGTGIPYGDKAMVQNLTASAKGNVKLYAQWKQIGWVNTGGNWYYLDPATGVKLTGWQKIDSKWYYLGTDGVMLTDWQKVGGKWYYLKSDMKTGWQQIGGVWYYLGTDGAMRTGWQTVNGVKYYFDANGAMQVSWKQVGGVWYYFGTNGHMQTGWAQVGGKWYYLGTDGAMQTGWKQINAKWYYLSTDGAMRTGWQTVNGVKYYLGTDGAMRTGMQTVDGKKYYFGTSGALTTTAGWQSVNGSWYYRGTDGAMVIGWKQVGGKWYYMDPSTAIMSTNWKQVAGVWYYLGTDGAMRTGWQKIGTVWYFFGTSGAMQTGWYQENGKWYYFKTSGAMACSESVKIGTKTYQFNASGVCTNP